MEKEKYQPKRFSRLYHPLNDYDWEFPTWYKKIINSNLFDLGYHKCKCNQLLRLHRQTCEIGFCPEDLKFF